MTRSKLRVVPAAMQVMLLFHFILPSSGKQYKVITLRLSSTPDMHVAGRPATLCHMWIETFAAEWCIVPTCSVAPESRDNEANYADDGITVGAVLMARLL